MDFTDSQYAQLIIALAGGIMLFALVYRVPERTTLAILILLVPFQLIDSRYGSLNTVLIFLVAGAFLMQGRLTKLPFLGAIVFILFSYLLAFSQSHPAARMLHIYFMVGFFGNILLFYIVYNFILRTDDWKFIYRYLIILNVLVAIYCGVQFLSGSEQFRFFGISEFGINAIRADGRLVGPFKATAATAEYLCFQSLFLGYVLMQNPTRKVRWSAIALLALNSLFIIATGNRGGFVTLIFGGLLFLYIFRRELGLARAAKMLVASTALFTIVALLVVNYTEYGMLFGRLENTTIEGGVPDTRSESWPRAWELIKEKPIFGHGPKLDISSYQNMVADIPIAKYAHNLPLHILYTTGIVGLIAWSVFFWLIFSKLLMLRKAKAGNRELNGMPRLGLVIFFTLVVSQMRIEFLRDSLMDYQNYLFVIFALLIGSSDLIVSKARGSARRRHFGRQPKTEMVDSA